MDLKTPIPGKESSEHQPRALYYYCRAILSSNFTVLFSDSLPFLGSPIRKGDILRANTLETLIFFFLSLFPLIFFFFFSPRNSFLTENKTKWNKERPSVVPFSCQVSAIVLLCYLEWDLFTPPKQVLEPTSKEVCRPSFSAKRFQCHL